MHLLGFGSLLRSSHLRERFSGTKDGTRNTAVLVKIVSGGISDIQVTAGALANDKQRTEIRRGLSIDNLFADVNQAQSMEVDEISGATLTSNAHLKALENALKQAESK